VGVILPGCVSVADPLPVEADPTYHFDADLDPVLFI
jgi:hypothetical protein